MSLKGVLEEKQLGLDDPGGEFAVKTFHLSHHCSLSAACHKMMQNL